MGCCLSAENQLDFQSISAVESVLDNLSANKSQYREEEAGPIQGPNPLTFQNVALSDTSSDIDEELIAEMTKSDEDEHPKKHKGKGKH
ncbi:hypothetical protein TVAG_071090 [Trichomonas vaginalis G3]|uniref:Uncharacterized protein n=1 Tax=Trichomonas vaginalis (strain ATCC PRA-98 / G3) TaxID=412133 RepID=A2D812_TRIV3|nr:hypothetical protein TVAGG3_1045740 [Trichomonas vaginalis G3]EAY23445.1 hypothetical protein TVAG_071090 [Trichomonas vaginalis G3]KAI5493858.1 hypothetical protein TVAGG3_1045740 [Trichomonas vaginalis G3]|eukprot:XP_001584431.1 hypothetical protein [Trichomonas vaginalis G3]